MYVVFMICSPGKCQVSRSALATLAISQLTMYTVYIYMEDSDGRGGCVWLLQRQATIFCHVGKTTLEYLQQQCDT